MLIIYRRHKKDCTHRSEGRTYRRCLCPIWIQGTDANGAKIRESLDLKDWQRAVEEAHRRETVKQEPQEVEQVTIAQAWEWFLADAQARRLSEATLYKYRLLGRRLEEFSLERGFVLVKQLDVDALTVFRASWTLGAIASSKRLETLRAFFRFAERRKWVDSNPADELKAPKVSMRPTMPFTREDMTSILAACNPYAESAARNGKLNAVRLRALVLLLRYSGLRIGDAIGLSTERISGNRLFLYTAKTSTPVYCVLPPFVVEALETVPRVTERYFFWNGQGKLTTAVKMWEQRLHRLFALTGIVDGHAHRFRDTFAVELLLESVPLDRVSILLGHQSIKVTERHYSPWTRSRQEQIEQDLERAWSRDPLTLTKGTPEVHREKPHVN